MGTSTVSGPFRSQNGFQELDGNGDWVAVGGGAVDSVAAGTGVSVNSPTGAVTITNTGLLSASAGTGISATTVSGALTIGNTGLLSASAGTGISATTSSGALTIGNTGVTSAVAGTGISVSSGTGAVTIGNTGVTSIVAGTNVTISGSTGAVTINASGGGGGGATIITANVVLTPNGSNVNVTIPAPTTGPVAVGTIYRFNIEQRYFSSGDSIPSLIISPPASGDFSLYGTVLKVLTPVGTSPVPATGNSGAVSPISYLSFGLGVGASNIEVRPNSGTTFPYTSGAVNGQVDLTYLGFITDPLFGSGSYQYNINGITNVIQY